MASVTEKIAPLYVIGGVAHYSMAQAAELCGISYSHAKVLSRKNKIGFLGPHTRLFTEKDVKALSAARNPMGRPRKKAR